MPDHGARYTDRKIRKVDRELQGIYRQAEKELKKKLADFVSRSRQRDRIKQLQRDNGEITEQQYKDWLAGQIFQQKRWESKIRQVQQVMYSHNEQAAKIVHENKLDVFAENYNREAFKAEAITGISFDVYNTQSVAKLVKDRPDLLPKWKIDEEKDYKWNYRKVNNAITEGIIQGESVDKIANRLTESLCTQNEKKMMMFARTALNAAQSAGRQAQNEETAKKGVVVHKQWLATHDLKTRDAHRHLDGDEVPYDKPFKSDLGEIRFPGDPEAEPANTYNCRCTYVTIYPEYEDRQNNWRENETIDGMTYEEWKENKLKTKRVVNESDVENENELQAIKAIAENLGIKEDVSNRHVMSRVADAFINNYGLPLPPSNWTGKTIISNERINGATGVFDTATCDIILWKDARFLDSIHEHIHARSRGLTENAYEKYWAIEEACVETITQRMAANLAVSKSVATEDKVKALGYVAEMLGKEPYELAVELIDIPLARRYDKLSKAFDEYCKEQGMSLQEKSLYRDELLKLQGVK